MGKRRFGGYLRRRTRDQEYGDEDPMGSVLVVEDSSPHVVRAPPYLVPGEDSDEGIKRHDREVDGQREQEVGDARPGRPNTIATADMVDEVHNVEEGHQRLPQKSAPILERKKETGKLRFLPAHDKSTQWCRPASLQKAYTPAAPSHRPTVEPSTVSPRSSR